MRSVPKHLWLMSMLALIAGCATPVREFDQQAAALGLERRLVAGDPFLHAIYTKGGATSGPLHIYIEGDGSPWIGHAPAADPTPRRAIIPALMQVDPARAIYLGRPCYHGRARDRECETSVWTRARYGEKVVTSMTMAIRKIIADEKVQQVALLGYSGGGTLAMLLAERLPEVSAVVTIAANLDTAAWAERHGDDLSASLNPAARPPLPPSVRQKHLLGGRDRVVPPGLVVKALRGRSEVEVVADFDHSCCWASIWRNAVADLD